MGLCDVHEVPSIGGERDRVVVGWVGEAPITGPVETNPMELGLDDSYSLSKGCYTGQEVLAKMTTHQSVKRRLVGLEIAGQGALQAGDSLHAAGTAASTRRAW